MTKKLQKLILFGASPFPETLQIVQDINKNKPKYDIVGILDDDPDSHNKEIEGVTVLGPLKLAKDYNDVKFVNCIGNYDSRLTKYDILKRLKISVERYETLIHPQANINSSAKIGAGCIIHYGAMVYPYSVLYPFCEIMANAVIGTNNTVCEGAIVASLVATTPNVIIGHYSHIGTGACIRENIKIGTAAQVAMGSVVFKDVPPGVFCLGNPLRFLSKSEVPNELLEKWEILLESC